MDKRTSSALLVVSAAFLWGSSFPAIKITLGGAQDELAFSFVMSFIRILIAAILGLVIMFALGRLRSGIFRQPVVWMLGSLNALSFILQHAGLAYTTASKTALLVNVNVVFVAVLSYLFFKERLGPKKIAGVLLGMSGMIILETGLDPSFIQRGEFQGDVLVFLAGLSWGLYILLTKKSVDANIDYVDLSVAVLVATVPFLLIPLPFVNVTQPVDAAGWIGIAYLGIVTTLPPLILWTKALKTLTATVTTVLLLLEVFFAVLLSILVIAERFLEVHVLGGAMILIGGILATSARNGFSKKEDITRR